MSDFSQLSGLDRQLDGWMEEHTHACIGVSALLCLCHKCPAQRGLTNTDLTPWPKKMPVIQQNQGQD
jgi:hypothetical protein